MIKQLYHLHGASPYYTNCFVLVGENHEAIAIDPSAPMTQYREILKEEEAKLTAILLTHGHWDHVDTLDELREATGALVYLAHEDAQLFHIQADEDFYDEEKLTLAGVEFRVLKTPGHTPGSVCFLCENLMFSGDTLFDCSVGRTDLEGGNAMQLMASLEKLKEKVTGNPKVLPGHESFSDMETQRRRNPYLNM